jgi:hypothetical protein
MCARCFGKHSIRISLGDCRELSASEATFDHLHDTPTVRSYDRGERLEERRTLMHCWDAQLTGRDDSTVIP